MTGEGREKSAGEELARAREELRATELLLESGEPRVAVTRLYYAVFHAVRALLYHQNLEPRTHAGAQSLFARHFVQPGRFSVADGRLLQRLEKYREEADYGDVFIGDAASTRDDLGEARAFVARAEAAIVPQKA